MILSPRWLLVSSMVATSLLVGCTSSDSTSLSSSSLSASNITVKALNDGIAATVPQYVMASVPASFALDPTNASLVTHAAWDFGDGSSPVDSTSPVTHSFFNIGSTIVKVTIVDVLGSAFTISNQVKIIPYDESLMCISNLAMHAPSLVTVAEVNNFSVQVPNCVAENFTGIQWNFGDGTAGQTSASVDHAFAKAGTFNVQAIVSTTRGVFVLTQDVVAVSGDTPPPPPPPPPTPVTYWITGDYGACSATCGGGSQTRTVTCQSETGQVYPDTSCGGTKPSSVQSCNSQSCVQSTNGGWVAYNWQPRTVEDVSSIQPCSEQGFYRTDIANGFHKPTSCSDVGMVCDLFETMGINLVGGWPQYMRCQAGAGLNGTWQVYTRTAADAYANIQSCGAGGFVRTGLQTYSIPSSCGDVGQICDNFQVMGLSMNGAWPQYYKCVQGGAVTGTWDVHTFTDADAYKPIQSCSQFGYYRTGFTTFHTPTSCSDKGAICDMFNVMGVSVNGAWPHYMECR